ncbi:MAG: hypothetical protein JOZ46_01325 [Candidatus Dormibacteraeota bacterium]|nr:hypothetical protein [Candidatus Dormibacteraeota bacterium]MBV9524435.1 hypothetical protein [Candidatus Dormibacteraeota bacterium]
MIERFKQDDAGYIRWSNEHPDGFVLHRKSGDFSLHRSQWSHIYEMGSDYALTSAEKLCAQSRNELVHYSREHTGRAPTACESCEP